MDFGVVELTDQTAKLSDEIWAENVTADESRDKTARLEEKITTRILRWRSSKSTEI